MRNVLFAGLCVCTFGCMGGGDGGNSSATFDGKVEGESFAAADSAAVALTLDGDPFATLVLLSDTAGACETLQSIADWKDAVTEAKDPILPSATIFWLMFRQSDSAGSPIAVTTGSYDIASLFTVGSAAGGDYTRMASAVFEQTDASCNFQVRSTAISGSATLNEVTLALGGHVGGSFDATMGEFGEQVAGSFDARYCAELEFTGSGSFPPACANAIRNGGAGGGVGAAGTGTACPPGTPAGASFQCLCDDAAPGTQTCQADGLLSDCLCAGGGAACTDGEESMPGAAGDPCPQTGTVCGAMGGKAVACCAGSAWALVSGKVACQCETAASPVTCSTGASGTCGNGVIDAGEQCDGPMLGATPTCMAVGMGMGVLSCEPGTCRYDTSMCTGSGF